MNLKWIRLQQVQYDCYIDSHLTLWNFSFIKRFYNYNLKIKLKQERIHHHIHVLIIFPDSMTETTTSPVTTQTTPVTTQATQCKPCITTTALLLLYALLRDVHFFWIPYVAISFIRANPLNINILHSSLLVLLSINI